MTSKVDMNSLISELRTSITEENFGKSYELCEKILSISKDDDIEKCKILLLLEEGKYQIFHEFIQKNNLTKKYPYEYCFSLFRLKKYQESLEFYKKNEDLLKQERSLFLLAQIHYYLGNYEQSVSIYEDLINKNLEDGELYTNYLASLILNKTSKKAISTGIIKKVEDLAQEEETFELFYNLACVYIELHDLTKSTKYLDFSSKVCQKTLKEDGYTDMEIENSLAPVKVQSGYINQLLGKINEAEKIYTQILKEKPSRQSVSMAVAGNNLVSIFKNNQSVYEAERRIKYAINPAVKGKLTKWQQRGVNLNQILLLIRMKKFDECKELFEEIKKQFPETDIPTLIEASLRYKEKNFEESIKILNSFINNTQKSIRAEISLAQLHINRSEIEKGLKVLKKCFVRHKPSIVGCLVGLYHRMGKLKECSSIFEESIKYWKNVLSNEQNKVKKDEIEGIIVSLLSEYANFKVSIGMKNDAVKIYEEMLNIDPNNQKYIARFVLALVEIDIEKSKEYAKKLPNVKHKGYIAKKLEKIPIYLVKERKKNVVLEDDGKSILIKKKEKKKRKKRKNKRPKNFNPNIKPEDIDPERWLPKWERSKYKNQKTKHKRYQGAVGGQTKELDIKKKQQKSKQQKIQKIIRNKQKKKKTKKKKRRR